MAALVVGWWFLIFGNGICGRRECRHSQRNKVVNYNFARFITARGAHCVRKLVSVLQTFTCMYACVCVRVQTCLKYQKHGHANVPHGEDPSSTHGTWHKVTLRGSCICHTGPVEGQKAQVFARFRVTPSADQGQVSECDVNPTFRPNTFVSTPLVQPFQWVWTVLFRLSSLILLQPLHWIVVDSISLQLSR